MKKAFICVLLAAAVCLSLFGCSDERPAPVVPGGDVMENKYGKAYFENARVGLFTHYTYATYAEDKGTNWGGTWYAADDPRPAASPEEAAAMFDGEKFAQTARDMGAEYVVFTLAHAGFNLLFPSETMRATGCTHKCTESADVVAKLIAGLKNTTFRWCFTCRRTTRTISPTATCGKWAGAATRRG